MKWSLFVPPLFSFLVTFFGIQGILRFFPKLSFLDRPKEYGLNRTPIPYSGGIIFFIVFLFSVLLFIPLTKPLAGILVASFLITVVSFLDDRKRLSPWGRLAVQIFAGVIVVFSGVKIQLIQNPFGSPLFLDRFSISLFGQTIWMASALFIIAWLVLMMNVMNWLDGVPGLASGVSTVAQVSLFLLSMRQFHVVDQTSVVILSSVLAVSTLVFLIFDFPKPKLLMGDTGSMFLGFMLGTLSILAGGKLATALLIMGFPVLDALWVIIKRLARGSSPLKGDYSHFHHRLLNAGLSKRKALFVNYVFCLVFAAIALFLHSTFSKFLAFIGVVVVMAIVGLVLL